MCLNPIHAKWITNADGELQLKFYTHNICDWIHERDNASIDEIDRYITLPCGHCFECNEQYSNEWSWRVMCEMKSWNDNECCFITLTYKDNPISLNKRDLQLFIKRLRKSIYPNKLRYFACGEYGAKGHRPHYHLVLFGYRPNDLVFFERKKNTVHYLSENLSKLWNQGFITVGDVNEFSAKYCAKYMQKQNTFTEEMFPPFTLMSLKPGIGLDYFKANEDKFIKTDEIFFNGKSQHIPRYFLRKVDESKLIELKKNRKVKADLLYGHINHKYDHILDVK